MTAWRLFFAVLVAVGTFTAAARSQTFSYDSLGRLVGVVQEDSSQMSFSYDAAGNRLSVAASGNGSGTPCPALNDDPVTWIVNGKWCTSGESYIPEIAHGSTQTIIDPGRFIWSGSATFVCQQGQRVLLSATCD